MTLPKNLTSIVNVILLAMCSGISDKVFSFNLINSISRSRDFWEEGINGCIVAAIVSSHEAHGHSKTLQIVFVMFKLSQ